MAGQVVSKPSASVAPDAGIVVTAGAGEYVGRGAGKLLGALSVLPVPVQGRCAADVGACTGGFTQVLVQRGAARVYAIDVGHGQLAATLRADPRVVNLEGVNARELTSTSLPEPCAVIVADLSFISLRLVLPALASLAAPGADALLLVKPQFEAGRAALDGYGVVRSPMARADAVVQVARAALDTGFTPRAVVPSAVPGAAGNREYFLWATSAADVPGASMSDLHASVLQDGATTATPNPGEAVGEEAGT